MVCRHCQSNSNSVFLDLGFAPPSNAYLLEDNLNKPESYFPLKVVVCQNCWLVQTEDYYLPGDLFNSTYAYFSSISTTWLEHAKQYSTMITSRLSLGENSLAIEIAANDGYLLKNFVSAGIPCIGIEPTASTAKAAEEAGIPIIREFFGQRLADRLSKEGKRADLILGNNVYGHVPDINDFTNGIRTLLKPEGTVTLEFPHLMNLIDNTLFDTIYHEHFSYLSLSVVCRIFARSGLRVYDVEQLSTHGGSLRIYGCNHGDERKTTDNVVEFLAKEERYGLNDIETYKGMQEKVEQLKDDLLMFPIAEKRAGRRVVGYGAAAKGNTLLNFAGVKPDLLPYVCDFSPSKQGRFLPGTHIPVVPPSILLEERPDMVLIFPWNLSSEIMNQLEYIRSWGGMFAVAIPSLQVM